MKKSLVISFGIFSLFILSCGKTEEDTIVIKKSEYNQLKGIPEPKYPKEIHVQDGWRNPDISIFLVDSCEYFIYGLETPYGYMCHKGNCKFCQQRLEQTISKVMDKRK